MTNREKIIELVKEEKNQTFWEELNWYLETYEGIDHADAFNEVWDFADDNKQRGLQSVCKNIAIEAGYMVEAPEKTDAGRDTRLTHKGTKYQVSTAWVLWIDK